MGDDNIPDLHLQRWTTAYNGKAISLNYTTGHSQGTVRMVTASGHWYDRTGFYKKVSIDFTD